MRRIDKTEILSTEYKAWEEDLEQRDHAHPLYTSSNFEYYLDIVMNLFFCQHGLCAYTEMQLCPKEDFDPRHWQNGRYKASGKPHYLGQLEHFDERLKAKKAWLWRNLFMVHSDINTKVKRAKAVDYILKPDSDDYDPFKLLEYNKSLHIFIANTDLPEDERKRINTMLETLGINFGPVRDRRERVLTRHFEMIDFEIASWDDTPDEFPTAFEMCKQEHS